MFHSGTVHPLNDTLVFVGGLVANEDHVSNVVGQVVPIAARPSKAGDVQRSSGNVGVNHPLGQESDPCIGGSTGAHRVGVDNGGFVMEDNVLIGSRASDHRIHHFNGR